MFIIIVLHHTDLQGTASLAQAVYVLHIDTYVCLPRDNWFRIISKESLCNA